MRSEIGTAARYELMRICASALRQPIDAALHLFDVPAADPVLPNATLVGAAIGAANVRMRLVPGELDHRSRRGEGEEGHKGENGLARRPCAVKRHRRAVEAAQAAECPDLTEPGLDLDRGRSPLRGRGADQLADSKSARLTIVSRARRSGSACAKAVPQ